MKLIDNPEYTPEKLFDHIMAVYKLKNDAALGRLLDIDTPRLSRLRHKVLPVGAQTVLKVHDITGLSVSQIRKLAGICTPHNKEEPCLQQD
jgi:hypothetical protein